MISRLTQLGNPVSVSTLTRWEDTGNLKVEDAYYLSQVYGTNPREQLLVLPFPPSPKELAADAARSAAEAEQTAQDAEALAARVREEDSLEREEDARPPGRSA